MIAKTKKYSLANATEPFGLFRTWFEEAHAHPAIALPEACCVATRGADGAPDARFVLLKEAGASGFVFYTNLESQKAQQLAVEDRCALTIYWEPLRKQVRIRGRAKPVSAAESDAYFATRARQAQLGAWVSTQSRPMKGRWEILRRFAAEGVRRGLGSVPRPPHWGGYRIEADEIEFWRERQFRLNERLLFRRTESGWNREWLFP